MRTKVLIYLTGLLVSVGLCAKAQTPVANKSYKQAGWFNINKSKMIEPPAGFKIQKTYKIANPIDLKSPKSPAVSDDNSKVWGYCIYDENYRTYGLVNLSSTDGIAETSAENVHNASVKVAADGIHISSDANAKMKAEVFSADGRMISSQLFIGSTVISRSRLKGTYVIRISNNNNTIIRKITI